MTNVLVPSVELSFLASPPDVVKSCQLFSESQVDPPNPNEEDPPGGVEDGPWIPSPPGGAVLPPAPETVDTSPERMIGCVAGVGTSPQSRLSALFPSAIDGDGVIDRATNDIWIFGGILSELNGEAGPWNNAGPTPGVIIINPPEIPPFVETVLVNAVSRTRVRVDVYGYELEISTEISVPTETTASIRSVNGLAVSPAVTYSLSSLPPSIPPPPVPYVGTGVQAFSYEGLGSNGPTFLPTSWPTSMAIFNPAGGAYSFWTDFIRGNGSAWIPTLYNPEFPLDAGSVTFSENGITVDGSYTNLANRRYIAYVFEGVGPGVANTSGAISSTVYSSEMLNIITYNSTGANTSFGHGLGQRPELMIFRGIGSSFSSIGIVAGEAVGGPLFHMFTLSGERTWSNVVRYYDSDVVHLGSSSDVNGLSSGLSRTYTCYAFKQVEGKSKIGVYTGNGLNGGKFVKCGFSVGLVLIKSRNAAGNWTVIDRWTGESGTTSQTWNFSGIEDTTGAEFFSFEGDGFRVKNGFKTDIDMLNREGIDYIFAAFRASSRTLVVCPPASISMGQWPPGVFTGSSLAVPSREVALRSFSPTLVGEARVRLIMRSVGLSLDMISPAVSSGGLVAVPTAVATLQARPAGYIGEATEEGRNYLEIVELRDGQALEPGVKGSLHYLIKLLKAYEIWDKFDLLFLTCLARTQRGAFVALRGGFTSYFSVTPAYTFLYNRRTGIKPAPGGGASIITGLRNNDMTDIDNHCAAYLTEFTTSLTGNDLIGASLQYNSITIIGDSSGQNILTRNKDNSSTVSTAPRWSGHSIVGTTRFSPSNYVVRLAKTNRTASVPIVDQVTSTNSGELRLFNFWNGPGTHRVLAFSFGKAIDLALLEDALAKFSDKLTRSLPNKNILANPVRLQLQAIPPSLVG